MLHNTQEQTINFNESVVKARSFNNDYQSPIPMIMKGLLRDGAVHSWTGYFGKPFNITYTFSPSAQEFLQLYHYLESVKFHLTHTCNDFYGINYLDHDKKAMMVTAFKTWEGYANIRFTEDNRNPLLAIYVYNPAAGYGQARHTNAVTTYSNSIIEMGGIGFNQYFFSTFPITETTMLELRASNYKVMLHEIGHALKLAHPFRHEFDYFGVEGEAAYTSSSIMNYDIEYYQGLPVIPTTPMPYDIEAVRLLYGNNLFSGRGDTLYNLEDYLPSSRYDNQTQHYLSQTYKTIASLPWDNQGVDTLSTQGIAVRHIGNKVNIINLRPFSRSYFETGFIAMPNIQIENVILTSEESNGKYRIVLNTQDNIVDMGSSAASTIILNPTNTGHDTVLHFNTAIHQLILEQPLGKARVEWHMRSIGLHNVTLAGYKYSYTHSTRIDFDPYNHIVLADVHPLDLGYRPIRVKQQNELDVLLKSREVDNVANNFFDAAVEFPEELFQDFQSAFVRGTFLTFITQLSDETLKKYQCSEQQIVMAHRVLQACITLYTGSMLSSLAGSLAISLIRYIGLSEQNALLAGMITADVVGMASNFTPLGMLKTAVSGFGTYAGSYCTLWCKKKVDHYRDPAVSSNKLLSKPSNF